MINFLRVVRGLCGFLFAMQVVGLLPTPELIEALKNPNVDQGKILAFLVLKLMLAAFFGGCFFGLRKAINKLWEKKYGAPHPTLSKSHWQF